MSYLYSGATTTSTTIAAGCSHDGSGENSHGGKLIISPTQYQNFGKGSSRFPMS